MLLAEMVIPQMFTAYAEDLGYLKNGLHHYQYFCEKCNQVFSSAWGRIPGSMSYCERGSYFVCPQCGKNHEKHVVYLKRNEEAPNKIRLTIKEYQNIVTLEVFSKAVRFDDCLNLLERSYKETFRFDIAKQAVSFSTYDGPKSKNTTIELGNPSNLEVFNLSILRFFKSYSLANSNESSKIHQTLRLLRESINHKLEKHLGHKISSMYVSPGQLHGSFLLPLFNIAYRLACPDAPNLPNVYREDSKTIQSFLFKKSIDSKLIDDVIHLTKQNKNFVNSLIEVKSLPNRPLIRRLLNNNPFNASLLAKSFALCRNYDCAIRMYAALRKVEDDMRLRWSLNKDLFNFIRRMKLFYGEIGAVRLIEGYFDLQIWDCVSLYNKLNKKNRKALKTESVKLKDLHDWLSLRHEKQTHKNMKFNVPEPIVRRLSMQKEQLRFFLPEESMQLLEAGHELHNCVASYGFAMKDNQKWIVLVSDDKGKLTACLEIKGNTLVQAKIDRNKPVSSDSNLNNSVIAWAKERKIKIDTWDIRVPDKKKSKINISA